MPPISWSRFSFIALVGLTGTLHANTIFDNITSTACLCGPTIFTNIGNSTERGAAFVPRHDYRITGAAVRLAGEVGSISASLYSDAGGVPGTLQDDLGVISFTNPEALEGVFSLSPATPFLLHAGDLYWLVLTPSLDFDTFAIWEKAASNSAPVAYHNFGDESLPPNPWVADGNLDVQFRINGDLVSPEPNSRWAILVMLSVSCLIAGLRSKAAARGPA